MGQIEWCKRQKDGIRIIEPNEIIAKDYFIKANNALITATVTPSDDWKAIGAYYACYDAIYAILQKAGIKCEIHDCSIALMPFLGFSDAEVEFVKGLKDNRTNAQYYVNRKFRIEDLDKIKDFILKCNELFEKADLNKIRQDIVNATKY